MTTWHSEQGQGFPRHTEVTDDKNGLQIAHSVPLLLDLWIFTCLALEYSPLAKDSIKHYYDGLGRKKKERRVGFLERMI